MGVQRGEAPSPVRLRRMRACPEPAEGVSVRYKFLSLPDQACPESIEGKGGQGIVERVFQHRSWLIVYMAGEPLFHTNRQPQWVVRW